MQFKKIGHNFFLRFIGIAALSLLVWRPFSVIYLHVIVPCTNVVLTVINPAVHVHIIDGVLRFQYTTVTPQLLQFSVRDVDQIYLNGIVFLSLMVSSYRVPAARRIKFFFAGQFLLLCIHIGVLIMYTYTNIWDFLLSQPEHIQPSLSGRTELYFSRGLTGIFRNVIYYWNSWGWDVIPLLLWLPIGIRQFSHVIKKNTGSSGSNH